MKHELSFQISSKTVNILTLLEMKQYLTILKNPLVPKPPVGFNMETFVIRSQIPDLSPHKCIASCCFAGHVALLNAFYDDYTKYVPKARKLLGLTRYQASTLFGGLWLSKPLRQVTIDDTIAAIDKLVTTGNLSSKRPFLSWLGVVFV